MGTNPQSYAVQVEHIMSKVFSCDRSGVGGLVSSDYIRRNPFLAMICTLSYLSGRNGVRIDQKFSNFFREYNCYSSLSLDELVGLDGRIPNAIVSEFRELCEESL